MKVKVELQGFRRKMIVKTPIIIGSVPLAAENEMQHEENVFQYQQQNPDHIMYHSPTNLKDLRDSNIYRKRSAAVGYVIAFCFSVFFVVQFSRIIIGAIAARRESSSLNNSRIN